MGSYVKILKELSSYHACLVRLKLRSFFFNFKLILVIYRKVRMLREIHQSLKIVLKKY